MEKDKESTLEALRQGRLAAYKVFAGGGNRTAYREVCKRARKEIRRILNQSWLQKAAVIQEAVDRKS